MKKVMGIAAGIGVILLVYGIGCYYFQSHFYYGTTIDGTDYGCIDKDRTEQQILQEKGDYELTVYGRENLTDVLDGEEAGIVFDPSAELAEILTRQRYYLWPLSFFETHDYTLSESVTVDEEKFDSAVRALPMFLPENMQAPEDAHVSAYSYVSKGYAIVPEKEGSRIRADKAKEAILEAVRNRETEIDIKGDDFYEQPSVRSDDAELKRKAEALNAAVGMKFTYDMHGVNVVVDADQIHNWLVEENGEILIDDQKAEDYVQALADLYDTYKKESSFTTVNGETKMLKNGSYGWQLDVEAEKNALLEMLHAAKDAVRTPVWKRTGYADDEAGVGDTYIEIDLGAQHLYVIEKDKVILESDFVSGNAARGMSTPAGIYGITYKARNAVLRGPGYATPVSFWMPFNRGIGLHDATWRSSFGGTIYKTDGSHGCINLPYSKAKEIYGFVEKNMPVVCYW